MSAILDEFRPICDTCGEPKDRDKVKYLKFEGATCVVCGSLCEFLLLARIDRAEVVVEVDEADIVEDVAA